LATRQRQADAAERAPQLVGLNNVRAALEWCFGLDGDLHLGTRLAAAAMSAFLALSLLTECHLWSRRVLVALDETQRAGPEEMWLETALGLSSMFTRGHSEEARVALTNSLRIAEQRRDANHQLRILSLLHMFHHRVGDVRTALTWAKRSAAIAATSEAPAAVALARAQLGISLTLTGDLGGARFEFEAALQHPEIFVQGFDYRVIASGYLARVLWLQGYPAQDAAGTRLNVSNAARSGHPLSLTFALSFAVPLLLWLRDISAGEDYLAWFLSHTKSYAQLPFHAVARGFEGQWAISRGHVQAGVAILEGSLRDLEAANYNIWATPFNISRSQALVQLGRLTEALALIDDTIGQTEENGDRTYIPELLRIKAEVLGAMDPLGAERAESCLTASLEWSRRQGARASELRAATDRAAILARQDRLADARAVLQPVFAAFTEGFDTADLRVAGHLLATLGDQSACPD
jgi:hypothetical protein